MRFFFFCKQTQPSHPRANEEIAQVRSKAKAESAALHAGLRKEQMRVESLERALQQKVGEGPVLEGFFGLTQRRRLRSSSVAHFACHGPGGKWPCPFYTDTPGQLLYEPIRGTLVTLLTKAKGSHQP